MLERKEILEIFRETKVLRDGHFLLANGRHTKQLVQISQVLQYPKFLDLLCEEIARRFKGEEIDVVISPAIGGILVAYEVAKSLGTRCLFTEREDGRPILRRGFSIEDDENVLIVEDIITTGASVQELIELIKDKGAYLRGVGIVLDRSGGKLHFGARTESLFTMECQSWEPADCPLCREGVPLSKIGKK